MKKAAAILVASVGTFVCLPSAVDARPADGDDVDMYVDQYAEAGEAALETCTALFGKREQDRCFFVQLSHWDKVWREQHPLEWGPRENALLRQRLSVVDQDILAKRVEINKDKNLEGGPDPSEGAEALPDVGPN